MNDENNKKLNEKYDSLIRKHEYKGKQVPFWFECGDGWYDLIDTLCSSIQNSVEQNRKSLDFRKKNGENIADEDYENIEVMIQQVKEKFGGLRFYAFGGDDYIRGMIRFAESMSYKICESCGKPGKLITDGWYNTFCDPCRDNDKKRKEEWETNYKKAAERLDENG
jgi:hypothetical protein